MVQIQNTDAISAIRNSARLSISEGFPQNLLPNVQAVIDMTPRKHHVCDIVKTASGSGSANNTIYTTPTDCDFYITAITLGVIKDASATSVDSYVTCVIGGVTSRMISIPGITLTAQSETMSISFPFPIKVDRGTSVVLTNSTNVAVIKSTACIIGYTVQAPMN